MGCNTCKDKKTHYTTPNGDTVIDDSRDTINLMPESLVGPNLDKNFVLKFVVFVVIGLTLPLVILALFYQLFMTFFFPKALTRWNQKFTAWFKGLFNKYATYKGKKEFEKRKKEFSQNRGYEEGSELLDIEVYDDEDVEVVEDINDNNIKK